MNTIYIYSEPFNGSIQSTMHNGLVDYTGEEVRNEHINEKGQKIIDIKFINQLTFEEYNKQKGGGLKTATIEEMEIIWKKYEENEVLTNFTEITAERYDDLLNCLPPKKWHKYKGLEIFFMGECYTSNIYTCCIFHPDTQKYYSALRRITETDEELEKTLLKSIQQSN